MDAYRYMKTFSDLEELQDYCRKHKKESIRSRFWGLSKFLYSLRFLYHNYFSVCSKCGFPYPTGFGGTKWGPRPLHFECMFEDD